MASPRDPRGHPRDRGCACGSARAADMPRASARALGAPRRGASHFARSRAGDRAARGSAKTTSGMPPGAIVQNARAQARGRAGGHHGTPGYEAPDRGTQLAQVLRMATIVDPARWDDYVPEEREARTMTNHRSRPIPPAMTSLRHAQVEQRVVSAMQVIIVLPWLWFGDVGHGIAATLLWLTMGFLWNRPEQLVPRAIASRKRGPRALLTCRAATRDSW